MLASLYFHSLEKLIRESTRDSKVPPCHTLVVDNLLVSCFTPIGKVDLEKQHVVEVEEQWSWSRGCSPTIAITSRSIPIKTDTHPS